MVLKSIVKPSQITMFVVIYGRNTNFEEPENDRRMDAGRQVVPTRTLNETYASKKRGWEGEMAQLTGTLLSLMNHPDIKHLHHSCPQTTRGSKVTRCRLEARSSFHMVIPLTNRDLSYPTSATTSLVDTRHTRPEH